MSNHALFGGRYFQAPTYRHRFVLSDGSVLLAAPREAKRYLDKRLPGLPPEVCWEINQGGLVRILWAEDIRSWQQEEL